MELHANEYQEKLSSLENGSIRYEVLKDGFNPIRKRRDINYTRCFQLMKVILYLELVLFVGWMGCIFFPNYFRIYENRGRDGYSDSTSVIIAGQQNLVKTTTMRSQISIEPEKEGKNIVSETLTATTKNPIDFFNDDTDGSIDYPNGDSLRFVRVQNPGKPPHVFPTHLFDHRLPSVPDPVTSGPSINHFDSTNINNEDYLDYLEPSNDTEYMDILSDINRDVLRNIGLPHSEFDSGLLESIEPDLSHDTSPSDLHVRHSFELSGEEMASPSWKKKRSTESSSSEETKTQTPLVKRSTKSSSSVSGSSLPSSENEETTEGAMKEESNCPKIVDMHGNLVEDPKKIIHYIKRNWFDWILENSIPDCIRIQFEKTAGSDLCGRLIFTCKLDESSETEDKKNELAPEKRSIRSATESNQQDSCAELVTSSRGLEEWRERILIGKDDPTIRKFYREFAKAIMPLALREIVELSTDGRTNMDEHWRTSMEEIKRNISRSTETRQILEENTATIDRMANELRSLVESTVDNYNQCHVVETTPEEAKRAMSAIRMLIDREKCTKNFDGMETKLNSLAAEVVRGEPLDTTVRELRNRFKNIVLSLSKVINSHERQTPIGQYPTGPVEVTHEQWLTYMLGLKQEISRASEDPAIRQQLEADGSPTEEQATQLREIVEYILRGWQYCYRVSFFGSRGIAKHAESNRRMMENSAS
ncbi:uncharacterized protein [Venturia canescens]|uniref:uncharacterized protein n=1 Tax=Venturia canescens TaxID=32260 RepID=UPI001C9CEFEE|nr:uncharacterized protein LOC122406374 [Venturia canescens]